MRRTSKCAGVIAVVLLALTGCGSDDQASTTSSDTPASQEFNGLRVTYADGGSQEPSAELVEFWFQEAIFCADTIGLPERSGLPVSPPRVEIVPDGRFDPNDGFIFYGQALYMIERHAANSRQLHKHEIIHWILHSRGVPVDVNNTHDTIPMPEWVCTSLIL